MYSFFKKYIDLFTGRQYLAYGFLFLLCFLIMTGQNFRLVPGNDDIVHTILIDKYGSALNFMIEQYKVWNSRYFTSLIMAYIMDKNVWLWRILNTFALFLLFVYSANIIKALYRLDIQKYIIVLYGIFASFALLSSGIWRWSITWATGSFNYLWPASALAISFYYLLNSILNKEKIKLFQCVVLIPVVLFACNTEQTALICITMYSIVILYYILKEKYFDKYILILYLFITASTLIVFLAPSVPLRYAAEVKTWYPMFNDISLIKKAVYGYAYTVIYGFLLYNYMNTILLSALLFIILKKQYNNIILNIISLLPLLYSLLHYIIIQSKWVFFRLFYNVNAFSKSIILNNYNEPFISVITGTLMILIIIYCIFKIKWQSMEIKYLTLLFLSAGLMSAFILSFSPTIYASGERIWLIPYTMYILSIAAVFMELLRYIDISSKKFIFIFSLYFIAGLVDLFGKVYR